MFRLFKVLKELKLYREYLKIIKKESLDSPEWTKLKLRKDWFGRIYTVFNLPPEVTQSPDFPRYSRPAFVFDQIKPINNYLTRLNLQEIIAPTMNPIEGTDEESFLVIYYFVFRHITLLWIFWLLIQISLIFLVVSNWSWIFSFF